MTKVPGLRSRDASAGAAPLFRHPVVELDYEFVDKCNVDTRSLERALEPLRRLPLRGNIRVVVTSQMDTSLVTRVGDHYSGTFRQDRIIGRVTAKTVTDHASSTEILIDAAALLSCAPLQVEGGVERLLDHEGRHLVLRDRREDAHSCVRLMGALSPADEAIFWMAALALEEYRIEAALYASGIHAVSYEDRLPDALKDWFDALVSAGDDWGSEQGRRVLELANEIITRSSYVVAAHRFGQPLSQETMTGSHWNALVGECWPMLLRLTRRFQPPTSASSEQTSVP